ncbi:MAG: hypothetical protein AAGA30_13165, partial [Planctomycetota bacterium]
MKKTSMSSICITWLASATIVLSLGSDVWGAVAEPIELTSWQTGEQTIVVQDSQQLLEELQNLKPGLSAREQIASEAITSEFSRQISGVEWLAPLAPVALSPFFGITMLAGLANFQPEWLPENALLSENSPLANPYMFWTFLILTVVTSLPRLSKVSKPIAQVADFLETYSAIVILLVLKVVSMESFQTDTAAEVAIPMQSGIGSVTWDILLMVAMAINIVVVNSVKFFFEILVWITPIP